MERPTVRLSALVARRVRELRESRGWSQEELAEAAGLSRDAVSRIERQDRAARLDTVATIASALGMSPAELLGKAGLAKRRPASREAELSRAASAALRQMPAPLANAVVRSLRLVASAVRQMKNPIGRATSKSNE